MKTRRVQENNEEKRQQQQHIRRDEKQISRTALSTEIHAHNGHESGETEQMKMRELSTHETNDEE